MKKDDLWDSIGDLDSYLELLCKSILLDKVKIIDNRIIVDKLKDEE